MAQKRIDGPKGNLLNLDVMQEFLADPPEYLVEATRQYGDVFRLPLGPTLSFYVVAHPDYVRELLVKQWSKTVKWERNITATERVAPHAMVIIEGDMWKQHRKLVAPAFHTQRIQEYVTLMAKHTETLLDGWQSDAVYDLHAEMTRVTMGIIGEILFDIPDIEKDAAHLSAALNDLLAYFVNSARAFVVLPEWVPTADNRKLKAARTVAVEFLDEKIQTRRAEGVDHGDVLSALLHAVDEDTGDSLSDDDVRDELYGLFLAGHETTAVLMTWTLYLLAQNPDMQEAVYDEAQSVLGDTRPTMDSLKQMPLQMRVLQEALRLYPPAWLLFQRTATEDIILGDYTIPEGGAILVSPYQLHHDERWWDDPYRFDPSRFEGDWKAQRPAYAYMPFGGGPRVCVGAHMAELEAQILLATIVRRYRFELKEPDQTVQPTGFFTLHPWGGMPLRVIER